MSSKHKVDELKIELVVDGKYQVHSSFMNNIGVVLKLDKDSQIYIKIEGIYSGESIYGSPKGDIQSYFGAVRI